MAVVRIPPVLRAQTGGARDVQVEAETVGAVLQELTAQYPALKSQLFEGDGLRRYINVFLNDQDVQYLQRLDTPVGSSDTVIILPAMAGGAPGW